MPSSKPVIPYINRNHPQARGLVLAVPTFERGGTLVRDISGFNNDGTLSGTYSWASERFGPLLNLSGGSDGLIDCGSASILDDIETAGGMSFCLLYKQTSSDGGAFCNIFTKNNGSGGAPTAGFWWMYHNGGETLTFGKDYDGATDLARITSTTLTIGTWYWIWVTWDGSATGANIHIYFNGIECAYGTTQDGVGSKISDAANSVRIGNNGSATQAINGHVADTRLWRGRVFTAREIAQHQADPWGLYIPHEYISLPHKILYTRESKTSLPSNDDNLAISFSGQDKTDVATDDATRVSLTGNATNPYLLFEFKDVDTSGIATSVTLNWNGQASIAPSSSTVRLQIYNRNSTTWEDVDTDSATAADTDFTLTGSVSPLTNYKDSSNTISCRVYQNPTYSSSSSSSRSSSSSSSSSRSNSSSSCRSSSSSSSSRSPSCWVAAEIFGGWYAPKTINARYYINNIAPSWFREFYIKNGKAIAKFISNKPMLKSMIRPLFEYFSFKGKKYVGE